MTERVAGLVLGLPAWAALVVVFALPALESSAFVGFVFPGEIALLLGGVLAEQGRVPLLAVLVAGFAGGVLGDGVGYAVGRRYGRRLLDGTLGRFVKQDHLDRAERYLAERGGRAVFLGRFTAALRVMVPGAAGMARMRYPTFLVYNAAGAAGWVLLSVLLGYLGGSSWHHVEHVASRVGDHPLTRRAHRRFPRSVGWVGRRVDPRTGRGLAATFAAAALVACTWTFLGVTEDVVAGNELATKDEPVHAWVLSHRTPIGDGFFRLVTHLGSSVVLVPLLLVVVGVLARRRRSWAPVAVTTVVYGAAVGLHAGVAAWVQRPRPPVADWIAPASWWSYPSGHTTQAWAVWGVLALLAHAYAGRRTRLATTVLAVTVAVLVSVSRVYLGVHWLTDVLGGAVCSGALLAGCSLVWLLGSGSRPGSATS